MPDYRRYRVPGGTYFFTVNLLERRTDLLIRYIKVLVFARATQGSRMPLAIARIRAQDLPATVVLDDSQAMTPELKLSNFDAVVVGARASISGDARAQSGDLEGYTPSAISLTERPSAPIAVTIDRIVP